MILAQFLLSLAPLQVISDACWLSISAGARGLKERAVFRWNETDLLYSHDQPGIKTH